MNLSTSLLLNRKLKLAMIFLISLVIGLIISSCSQDEINSDNYYIKYQVDSETIYYGNLNVLITDENSQSLSLQIPSRSPWEVVIGPVKKGFSATVQVNEASNNYGHLSLYLQIHVGKNEEPFALKAINANDEPRTNASLSYIVE